MYINIIKNIEKTQKICYYVKILNKLCFQAWVERNELKMNKTFTKILLVIAIIIVIAGIAGVGYGVYKKFTLNIPNPVATIEIENFGTIKVELYPDKAPNTVANFIRLANRGFYDGTTFHRTMPNFVIQGGARDGDASASPLLSSIYDLDEVLNNKKLFEQILKEFYDGEYTLEDDTVIDSYASFKKYKNKYEKEHQDSSSEEDKSVNSKFEDFLNTEYTIEGEFIANGNDNNNLKHTEGVISMARSDYSTYGYTQEGYNSAGCQFFIMTTDNNSLDGLYSSFGKVIEGMDVVEKIANVEVYYRDGETEEGFEAPEDEDGNTIPSDTPKEEPVITSIKVETYGVDYGAPEVIMPFDVNSIFQGLY